MENNVLIITRSLPFHNIGGMEAVAWDIARGLAKDGVEVSILTTQAEALPSLSMIEGVSVHTLDVPSGRYSPAWWRESRRTFATTYAEKIDVVLSISAAGMSVARWIKETGGHTKSYVQAHGTAWGEIVSKLSSRSPWDKITVLKNICSLWADRGYRNFDGFISVGPKVTHMLQSWPTKWVTGALPCREITNGIDTDLFSFSVRLRARKREALGLKPEHKVIMSVGRLHKQKGLMFGLKGFALAARRDPMLRYLIVGSGPEERSLRDYVRDTKLEGRAIFCGAVRRDALPAYYAAADVFLFPTLVREGLPLNMLEALACGLPCMVSRHVALDTLPLTPIDPRETEGLAHEILEKTRSHREDRTDLLPDVYRLDRTLALYKQVLLNDAGPE